MNYEGLSKELLESSNISVGDIIHIEKPDVQYDGMLLEHTDDVGDKHIVIKMDSGYNVGIKIDDAKITLLEKGDKPQINLKPLDIEEDENKMNISIISTGGTVASMVDYKTGAVHPAFTADDLLRANPELLDYANISGKAIFNILSENMKPEYWIKAAHSIADEINDGADGVVVAHGTDTMHYTASALSFMMDTPVPIVLTGSQRSSDRPSSDAFLNLINSVGAAKGDIAEVMVCMYGSSNDDTCNLHKATKVRKMHTSMRETFRSINSEPIAILKNGNMNIKTDNYVKRGSKELNINDNLETHVEFIKIYPGIDAELIDYHLDKGKKGIVLEGTGLGHCPDTLIPALERAKEENVPIVMTSQCIYGRVNMNVYSTGRRLQKAGVIPGGDMLPETAFVKLMFVLGQTDNLNEVKNLMCTNLSGELNTKSLMNTFLI